MFPVPPTIKSPNSWVAYGVSNLLGNFSSPQFPLFETLRLSDLLLAGFQVEPLLALIVGVNVFLPGCMAVPRSARWLARRRWIYTYNTGSMNWIFVGMILEFAVLFQPFLFPTSLFSRFCHRQICLGVSLLRFSCFTWLSIEVEVEGYDVHVYLEYHFTSFGLLGDAS